MPCDKGQERNPATNRCRKVIASPVCQVGAVLPSEIINQAASGKNYSNLLIAASGLVIAGYGAYEWRFEILSGVKKVYSRFRPN